MKNKPETLAEKTARLKAMRLARGAVAPRRVERSYPILGLDDELPFGKHRGSALRDVIESDIGWVQWALDEIKTFEISDEAHAEMEVARDVRRPPRAWEG